MRSWLLLSALSLPLLPARAAAEGSTLSSVKVGACALLSPADAQRVARVPMQVVADVRGSESPGRTCLYRPSRSDLGRPTVQLRLLDAREWSAFAADTGADKLDRRRIKGVGDDAYLVGARSSRRTGMLTLFVRRGGSQFSVRFAGAGLALTDAMKQLARGVAARL